MVLDMNNFQMVIVMKADMCKDKLMDKENIIGKTVLYTVVILSRVIEKEKEH